MAKNFIIHLFIAVLIFSAPVYAAPPLEKIVAQEYQVKAAFIIKFIPFVKWPEQKKSLSETTFQIGVWGEGPVYAALDSLAKEAPGGIKLNIKKLSKYEEIQNIHILFINYSSKTEMQTILEQAKGKGILTISDVDGFAPEGGMINFVVIAQKVRFEINPQAVHLENIIISSKLMKLSRIIRN